MPKHMNTILENCFVYEVIEDWGIWYVDGAASYATFFSSETDWLTWPCADRERWEALIRRWEKTHRE